MYRRFLIALTLLLVGCGGATAPPTTVPAPTTSELGGTSSTTVDTVAEATTSTTSGLEPTTRAPAPTTTPTGGAAAIQIDEIVFAGGPYLIISNRGTGVGSTSGHWICQFPSYYELPAVDLQPGEKLAVPLGTDPVPELAGVVATVDVSEPLGVISPRDGEMGLYSANMFSSPEAIEDYVEWGTTGHARSSVAVAAGIWQDGGFVEVPAAALAIVSQAFPTVGPDDWFAEIGG